MSGTLKVKIEENFEIAEKVNLLKEELKLFEEDFNQKYMRRSNEINDIISREMRVESLTRENDDLKTKLGKVEKECEESNAKLEELKKNNLEFESNLRQANEQILKQQTIICESNQANNVEIKLRDEVEAWKKAYMALEISLKEEKKKNDDILNHLITLKKENQERQEKFDLESYRQQKLINELKACQGDNGQSEETIKLLKAEIKASQCDNGQSQETIKLLRAEVDAEKTINATQQKLLDGEKLEKDKLKLKARELEEKFLLIQMNIVQNRSIFDSKEADFIKKLKESQAQINNLKESNSLLAKNNRFLMDKIDCVTRLDERIDNLSEKKALNLNENQKFQDEISRLNEKRVMNIKIMRETIEGNSQTFKRKLNESEKLSTMSVKKTSN